MASFFVSALSPYIISDPSSASIIYQHSDLPYCPFSFSKAYASSGCTWIDNASLASTILVINGNSLLGKSPNSSLCSSQTLSNVCPLYGPFKISLLPFGCADIPQASPIKSFGKSYPKSFSLLLSHILSLRTGDRKSVV